MRIAAIRSLRAFAAWPAATAAAPSASSSLKARSSEQWSAITPGYFSTMGIPVVAVRAFTSRDNDASPLAVIVSQNLARRVWPNASPIGKTLVVGRFPGFAEVVGVAGDVKNNGLAREPALAMYTPYPQRPWPAMQFALRVAGGDPLAVVSAVRNAVLAVDRDQPVYNVRSLDQVIARALRLRRFQMLRTTTESCSR